MKRNYRVMKIAWMLVTNRTFRHYFLLAFDYAITNHYEKRGPGASDVLVFEQYGFLDEITK